MVRQSDHDCSHRPATGRYSRLGNLYGDQPTVTSLNQGMKINSLTSAAIVALIIFALMVLVPVSWFLFPEPQDVLLTSSSTESVVGMDEMIIGRGQVCIPKVKRGVHTFFAQQSEYKISREFFVSANTVIIKKEGDISGKQIIGDEQLQLKAEPTSCKTWTFGSEKENALTPTPKV